MESFREPQGAPMVGRWRPRRADGSAVRRDSLEHRSHLGRPGPRVQLDLVRLGAVAGVPPVGVQWASRVAAGGREPDRGAVLDLNPDEHPDGTERVHVHADRVDDSRADRDVHRDRGDRDCLLHLDRDGGPRDDLCANWRRQLLPHRPGDARRRGDGDLGSSRERRLWDQRLRGGGRTVDDRERREPRVPLAERRDD